VKHIKSYLFSILAFLISISAFAYLSPTTQTFSGSTLFPNGTVSAPSVAFTNSTNAGLYRIGADDIGWAVAGILGIEAKKATGSFVNIGMGGAASSADTFPLYIARSQGTAINALLDNPATDAGAGVKWQLKADNGSNVGEIGLFTSTTASPAAYGGGQMTMRSNGATSGISLIADDVSTAKIKMFAAGNGATDEVARVHSTGFQIMTQNAKPTCIAALRGTMYYTRSAALAADLIEICMKQADDNYGWVNFATAP
jgi:hypothetical protein